MNFNEIVDVIGGGNWENAQLKIRRAWGEYKQGQKAVQSFENTIRKTDDDSSARYRYTPEHAHTVEPMTERRARTTSRRSYTIEDLKKEMAKIQDYVGTKDVPTQIQINRAAREIGTPSYTTFAAVFGPKYLWAGVLGLEEPAKPTEEAAGVEFAEASEPQTIEPEMAEVPELQKEAEVAETSEPQEVVETEVLTGDLVICGIYMDAILDGRKMRLKVELSKE